MGCWRAARSALGVLLLALAGCRSLAPLPEPELEPAPPEPPKRILLLVADEGASLQAVAGELEKALPRRSFDTIPLGGAASLPADASARLRAGRYWAAVAIGYPAGVALIGTGTALEKRVFCQVFDYRELAADGMAGVSLLPPAGQSLGAWKRLSPELETLGMLTGLGMDALALEHRAAAEALNLTLVHREVGSDQALYQTFRVLARSIDGLLLIPDHRVLSPGIIRQVFDQAARRSVEVLAYTPGLLELGAVAVASNDPGDVAARVLNLLNDEALYRRTRGNVIPLKLVRIETRASQRVARQAEADDAPLD